MNEKKTIIAIPTMSMVPTEFMYSMACMRRVGYTSVSVLSNSLVYMARNALAAEAIDRESDRVLWLDSDMCFNPDLMELLAADMDTGLDYISCLYFRRRMPTQPVAFRSVGPERADPYFDYPQDQIFEVAGSGFGAVMMNTKMLRDVYDNFGPPFNPGIAGLGEDLEFCRRARQLGYKLYCDSSIKVGHVGTMVIGEEYYRAQQESRK